MRLQNKFEQSRWRLIVLCADWCGVCREYQPIFTSIAQAHDKTVHTLWLDVESPQVSSALGDIEIENFPFVAIGNGDLLLFWGSTVADAHVLQQLLYMAQHSMLPPVTEPSAQNAWRALSKHLCAKL